ncbi:DUF2786 domain-containing protein [Thalassobius sp. Cn5-15]|uniref:DUF7168 domain-containing protein n=1 Tax=Thalassobius sp. Cn5-15 TaxID=2917763 RepID=UPI001EF382B0|nr:DUF2786 domain-containing protein [Thalassobius sp. Cn5-15]MCG7492431.1 DUF2786 domain-containing protein [Thalassobius sp. Cn5-15]
MNEDRKALLERIRAMQAKAESEAASENEAMQAAAMAAKLMAKHEVTEQELDLIEGGAAGVTMERLKASTKTVHMAVRWAASGIEDMTETTGFFSKSKTLGREQLVFTGIETDAEMAIYLALMIRGAADRAWKSHAHGQHFRNRNKSRKSFMIGFGVRISERLRVLGRERRASRAPSGGTDLVIRKQDLIERHLSDIGLDITEPRKARRIEVDENYHHGRQAGDHINLSRPIEEGEGDTAAIKEATRG